MVLVLALLSSNGVRAADITTLDKSKFDNRNNGSMVKDDIFTGNNMGDDGPVVCNIALEGEIRAGDAERLRGLLGQFSGTPRVCLNSVGGDYKEALELVRVLTRDRAGTGLRPNARCASACAIAFMGGSAPTKGQLNRFMHPSAMLAFHAPYIDLRHPDIPRDRMPHYPIDTIEESYRKGVSAIKELMEIAKEQVGYFFPKELLTEMLRKGPLDTYSIDTVGKVIRFNIHLYGAQVPSWTDLAFCNACTNFHFRADERHGQCPQAMARPKRLRLHGGERLTYPEVAPRGGDCVIDLELNNIGLNAWYIHEGGPITGTVGFGAGGLKFAYWYLYAPNTSLSSLVRR
jgi:hypothetical protein